MALISPALGSKVLLPDSMPRAERGRSFFHLFRNIPLVLPIGENENQTRGRGPEDLTTIMFILAGRLVACFLRLRFCP